ncbi:AraC family transcriptional regulator [Sphingomonas sp. 28-63-12]|uniref:AraC family transcriptional regulator n=1 Tax=Sphingomonas sp. 28-63-12 TaxID=1970434 RepID=UPI000BD9CAEB|nr:MAG: hypothetical protein B7Y47_14270 [Sphingomonas sp. 28-63-12]
MINTEQQSTGIRPEHWRAWATRKAPAGRLAAAAAADPRVAGGPAYLDRALLQCWTDTSPDMRQPALDHHLIVLHQGGPKRIERIGGGPRRLVDAPIGASSTVESGSTYRWRTQGPIAFTHLYVAPARFADIVAENFDRDPRSVGFAEAIGRPDPHVARLFDLMMAARGEPDWQTVADYYLDALLIRLATTSTTGAAFRAPARLMLTQPVIGRVRDFIRGNLAQRITLGDLAGVAGYSRYHFVRAFRDSTGQPPYAFLLDERVRVAQQLLQQTEAPIAEIAQQTGFGSHAHFSARFRDRTGLTPADYRRRSRGDGRSGGVSLRSPAPTAEYSAR